MSKVPARKQTDIVQLKLRIREELRNKLERAAAKKKHSLNTEMMERLEASFTLETQVHDQKELLAILEAKHQEHGAHLVAIQANQAKVATNINKLVTKLQDKADEMEQLADLLEEAKDKEE